MKHAIFSVLLSILFFNVTPVSAQSPTKVRAKQVSVVYTNWSSIDPVATADAPSNTIQAAFDWLDTTWSNKGFTLTSSGWTKLPDTNNYQELWDWVDSNVITNEPGLSGYLAGTNIVNAAYTNNQWDLTTHLDGSYVLGTNISGAAYDEDEQTWIIPVDEFAADPETFYSVVPVGTQATISVTNGYCQYFEVATNLQVLFEPASIVNCDALVLWVKSSEDYTLDFDSSYVNLDSSAPSMGNTNAVGMFVFHSNPFDSKWYQEYKLPAGGQAPVVSTNITASGGTITTNDTWVVHTFESDGTFSVFDAAENATIEILAVGGGGGGGGVTSGGGGGGAAQLFPDIVITSNTAYTVVVGTGGAGSSSVSGSNGGNSYITIAGTDYKAKGGGGGGDDEAGKSKGTGGGGGAKNTAPYYAGGTGEQGGDGGRGGYQGAGGGGGASTDGDNVTDFYTGSDGGDGYSTTFRLAAGEVFGGGGGGGGRENNGAAGDGGGGVGGDRDANAGDGTDGFGGGGGGGGYPPYTTGGDGGDGVVIIRYPAP